MTRTMQQISVIHDLKSLVLELILNAVNCIFIEQNFRKSKSDDLVNIFKAQCNNVTVLLYFKSKQSY